MKDALTLLTIVGMPGAGKSVAALFFREQHIPVLRFGDQTDIGLTELGLSLTESNERMYREKIRQELGMAAMAIKIEPRIRDASVKSSFIVLDGLYSWEEYVFLKGKFPQLLLLCIYAAPGVRYQRLAVRKVRPLTEAEAKSRDIAEIEHLNKGGPIAMADFVIINDTDEQTFRKHLLDLYRMLV